MRIPRVYLDMALPIGQHIDLPQACSHYLSKVLRCQLQQKIILFNGDGRQIAASIIGINKKTVTVLLHKTVNSPNPSALRTYLGQVISRGNRMDYVVQKATEMGVNEITPLYSERCEVKLDHQRYHKRMQHWQRIVINACEQSGRCDVPIMHLPQTVNAWIASCKAEIKLIMHPYDSATLNDKDKPNSCALLIGPEGGFTHAEVNYAKQREFIAINLGPRILRTETATVVSLSLLQHLWG